MSCSLYLLLSIEGVVNIDIRIQVGREPTRI